MTSPLARPAILVGIIALALAAPPTSTLALAQDPTAPALSVSKIIYQGPSREGSGNVTFSVTVTNAEGRAPTPPSDPVIVKVIMTDPSGRRSEFEGRITTSISPNGSQTGVVSAPAIYMREGTHSLMAWASLPATSTRAVIRSPDKVDKVIIGAPLR